MNSAAEGIRAFTRLFTRQVGLLDERLARIEQDEANAIAALVRRLDAAQRAELVAAMRRIRHLLGESGGPAG